MKILITTPFYPPDTGGISYHVSNIARRLSEKHDVIVVKNDNKCGMVVDEQIPVIKILSRNLPPYPYQTLSSFRMPILTGKLGKLIKNGIDIVHSHGHHYPITWFSEFCAKRCNIPTVLTLHGMYALNPYVAGGRTRLEELFNKTVFKIVLKKSDSIIGLTDSMINYAKRYGPAYTRYYEIPNGVDMNLYRRNLPNKMEYRAKYALPQDKLIILFRGRFTHVKSVLEAAYAVKRLARFRNDLFFLFVGDGPLKYVVEGILGEVGNVKVWSWMPSGTIHELFIASDIYLLPSKWEGLPITLMEAMAANLYIVSTPVGGVGDIIQRYPSATTMMDSRPSTIFEALWEACDICNSTERKSSEIDSYVKRFDWNAITNEIERVYTEITPVNS